MREVPMTFFTVVPGSAGDFFALRTTFPIRDAFGVIAAVGTPGTVIARGATPQEALKALREERVTDA